MGCDCPCPVESGIPDSGTSDSGINDSGIRGSWIGCKDHRSSRSDPKSRAMGLFGSLWAVPIDRVDPDAGC